MFPCNKQILSRLHPIFYNFPNFRFVDMYTLNSHNLTSKYLNATFHHSRLMGASDIYNSVSFTSNSFFRLNIFTLPMRECSPTKNWHKIVWMSEEIMKCIIIIAATHKYWMLVLKLKIKMVINAFCYNLHVMLLNHTLITWLPQP